MKPLLISSGEPAGIGPDLCLAMAAYELPIVVIADKKMLLARAQQLGLEIILEDFQSGTSPVTTPHHLSVLPVTCPAPVVAGVLNPSNAPYVVAMLRLGIASCLQKEFSALITAPVHKTVINQAGISFTGHTEFFAQYCNVPTVVMMLVCPTLKVALITTHLPLKEVANAVTAKLITDVITTLHTALIKDFKISNPKIYVAGLNPHAGENGYLGREEIETIIPTLNALKKMNIDVHGPLPADTMFTPTQLKACDVFVAMYHDQGLPVLKYAGFGNAVNVTLGLPIIRTSVDHGTALPLAGTGLADAGSMLAAIEMASFIAQKRDAC